MKTNTTYILFTFVATWVLASSSAAQTVSITDLSRLAGKFELEDSTGHLGKCLEWWRDSAENIDLPARLISYDTGQRFPSDTAYLYNSRILGRRQPLQCDDSLPTLPILPQVFYGYPSFGSWLTVWEYVGQDSARYLGGVRAGYGRINSDSTWLEGIYIYPDTSYLLHICSAGEDNSRPWGGDVFIRFAPPDSFTVLHQSAWSAHRRMRHFYDLSLLRKATRWTSYSVIVTSEFLNENINRRPWEPMAVDSATVQVIDFWKLAAQKCGLDTLPTWRRYR